MLLHYTLFSDCSKVGVPALSTKVGLKLRKRGKATESTSRSVSACEVAALSLPKLYTSLQYFNAMFVFHENHQLSHLPISFLVLNNLGIDHVHHLTSLGLVRTNKLPSWPENSLGKLGKLLYEFMDALLDANTNNRPRVCSVVNHGKNSNMLNTKNNITCSAH